MNSQWSDNLRKKMEAHKEPSPDGLWEDIEQLIIRELHPPAGERIVKSPSPQKKVLLWAKRIAATAAILLILFFAGDFFLKENTPLSPTNTQRPEAAHMSDKSLSVDHNSSVDSNSFIDLNNEDIHITEEKAREQESLTTGNNTATFTTLASTAASDRKMEKSFIDKDKEEINNEAPLQHPDKESGKEGKTQDILPTTGDPYANNRAPEPNNHSPIITRRARPARWQTNLYASNISSGDSKRHTGYRSFLSEEISLGQEEISPLLVKNPHAGIMVANKQNAVYSKAKHKQPVTVGISLKYNLDRKWSVTSGLTYTLLSSELLSGSDNNYYTSEQTLHNIGIPLSMNYTLWNTGNASIYLSGGGMLEKNISGKLTTDYVVDNQLESTEKNHMTLDRLQWSLNSSLGIEYNFSSKIGLYAEPGVIYYFKNGSRVETIYKEKPLNFNLRVGLRFSWSE